MKYNETIKKQLEEYITEPTVLMTKDEKPYEYNENGSINRLKRRRNNDNIPLQLYSFLVINNIPKNQLREFASGLFLNYIDISSTYC